MLKIKNLFVSLDKKTLLYGINARIEKNKICRIYGKNGCGKTTLVNTIAGSSTYNIDSGQIIFNNEDITKMDATERALKGIFLGAQNVPEIPGLTVMNFLKHSLMAHVKYETKKELLMGDFLTRLTKAREQLNIPESWLTRYINVGFSGGERKKLMLLRLILTQPKLAILDEPDSGADAVVQKQIIDTIKSMPKTTFIIISHQDSFVKKLNISKTYILDSGKITIKK
ncbi:MAG: ATP-binding cassette domain-containing protein [Alphaproteobacteria bacterium]|nr:ATP-binding cassette domain-containing protein [Alphaproteobacteria bacterium]